MNHGDGPTRINYEPASSVPKNEALADFIYQQTGDLIAPGAITPRDIDRARVDRRAVGRLATKAMATLEWHMDRGNLKAAAIAIDLFMKLPPPPLTQRVQDMPLDEIRERMKERAVKAGMHPEMAERFILQQMALPGENSGPVEK